MKASIARFTLLFWALTAALIAQESRATVGGRVTDSSGGAIPGVAVEVISDDTGVTQRSRTNEKGNWTVLFLLPGSYHFTLNAPGFESITRTGVVLEVADNKTIDIELKVGSSSAAMTVTSETPLIDTTSSTSGVVIGSKEILEMPSISRLPSEMANLSAGVYAQDPSNNINHAWSHDGASAVRVGGGSGVRSNNYLLDGFPNVKSGGQLAFSPPPDSLSEFRVQMNAYDATVGRQAGGTLNMTTKSGTSAFHGSLYEFNQNNALNAQLFQTNLAGGDKPAVHYNEYGGTFGGPAWIPKVYNGRQRTFFFLSFNGIRNSNPTFGPRSLPNERERAGDFSQSYTTQLVNGQRVRYPIQIYDPLSVNANGFRQPFQGNMIPANRLDPIAQNILKSVPLPNHGSDGTSTDSNNFFPSSIRRNKMATVSARGDHQWNDSNRSFAVLRWYHEDEFAYDDFNSPATGGTQTRIAQNLGLDHVITASTNKVTAALASTRRHWAFRRALCRSYGSRRFRASPALRATSAQGRRAITPGPPTTRGPRDWRTLWAITRCTMAASTGCCNSPMPASATRANSTSATATGRGNRRRWAEASAMDRMWRRFCWVCPIAAMFRETPTASIRSASPDCISTMIGA
jgi:hypothetical protein